MKDRQLASIAEESDVIYAIRIDGEWHSVAPGSVTIDADLNLVSYNPATAVTQCSTSLS